MFGFDLNGDGAHGREHTYIVGPKDKLLDLAKAKGTQCPRARIIRIPMFGPFAAVKPTIWDNITDAFE